MGRRPTSADPLLGGSVDEAAVGRLLAEPALRRRSWSVARSWIRSGSPGSPGHRRSLRKDGRDEDRGGGRPISGSHSRTRSSAISRKPATKWSTTGSPSGPRRLPGCRGRGGPGRRRWTFERAILVCGTGIGMAITASRVPGVGAATSPTRIPRSAPASRTTPRACARAAPGGPDVAAILVDHWLASEFHGGDFARKVAKIDALDAANVGRSGGPLRPRLSVAPRSAIGRGPRAPGPSPTASPAFDQSLYEPT